MKIICFADKSTIDETRKCESIVLDAPIDLQVFVFGSYVEARKKLREDSELSKGFDVVAASGGNEQTVLGFTEAAARIAMRQRGDALAQLGLLRLEPMAKIAGPQSDVAREVMLGFLGPDAYMSKGFPVRSDSCLVVTRGIGVQTQQQYSPRYLQTRALPPTVINTRGSGLLGVVRAVVTHSLARRPSWAGNNGQPRALYFEKHVLVPT